jgi:hypothetical protein
MNEQTKPAVMAGLGVAAVMIVLSFIPGVSCCNCFLPLAAGVLAVYLYAKNSSAPLTPADGAKIGAIAGVAGGLLNLIIGTPLSYLVNAAVMQAQFAQMRERGVALPESLTGLALFIVMGIIGAVVSVILAAIGGLIGAAIFGKNRPGGATPPPPPPAGNYGGGAPGGTGGGYGS